jgi:hypothetical protein
MLADRMAEGAVDGGTARVELSSRVTSARVARSRHAVEAAATERNTPGTGAGAGACTHDTGDC